MARGSAQTHLPLCPAIDIEFRDVTYDVEQTGSAGKKNILHGISGKFLSGELTGILGPSGAGKSSFLDILTGFRTTGSGGNINSSSASRKGAGDQGAQGFRKQSRYIMQDDKLCPLFTVKEIMHVAACCKLGCRHTSANAKQLMVDNTLEAMGLESTKDTACGKLSGGQKKRLSIALELLDNPPVIFLDEPTTGLDSLSSLQVVSLLKTLAQSGRTVVCTIHQPCFKSLSMFDHLYVIAEGCCVYQGSSDNIMPFLSSVGFDCPKYHNPADYIIEVASGEYGYFVDELSEASTRECWRNTYGLGGSRRACEATIDESRLRASPPSEIEKFPALLSRCFIQLYRDWTVTHLKCLLHVIVGLILGCNFQNMGSDASKTVSNVAFLMITLTYLIFSSMMPSILRFPSELPVLRKEKFNRWYCLRTYYTAVLVSSFPIQVMSCIIHISVTYLLTAQPLVWYRFAMFFLVSVITTMLGDSIGLLFGTLFNPVNGTFLGSVFLCFMVLFGGFICLVNDMPGFVRWMTYLSTFRYSLTGLALSVYDYGRSTVPCPDSEIYCHLREPRIILRTFSTPEGRYWINTGVLLCFLVFFLTTTFYSLRMRIKST